MEASELLLTAGRAVAVYVFMLVVIRLLGKREVGSFSAFDFLVALMLGEVVDEIIYGDVSMWQGGVAVLAIALCQYVTGWMTYLNHSMDKLVEGVPTLMIENGELQRDAMRKERMNEQEIMALLRLQQVDDLREVKMAVLEVSGELTVIKESWAETVQKSDLAGDEAKEMLQATGGKEEPPQGKQTYSPRALGWES